MCIVNVVVIFIKDMDVSVSIVVVLYQWSALLLLFWKC